MGQLPETLVLEAFNGSSSPPGIQLLQLLIAIQAASLASSGGGPDFDPKYYVDLPLKYPVDTTAEAFSSLPRTLPSGTISSDTLQRFLEENFGIPGSDLVACRPQDYTPEPVDFLPGVYNPEARRWALKIHSLWLLLARQVADCVKEEPNQHTLLPLQHPVIVPGDRFREVYYWDSYWIIRGLLVSKMLDTAKGMVQNLLALAGKHGFVANGARTYYQNRSQPPLLSMMVCAIHLEAANLTLVEQALPILRKEHKFWTTEPHEVVIQDHQKNKHRLSRYYAQWNTPRPESCIIDEAIAKGLSKAHQAELYHDIATAAESGWDFSSRWMEDHQNLFSLRTSAIIPVDLNAFLLQVCECLVSIVSMGENEWMRWVESHVYHEEVQERLQKGLCSRHRKVFLRLALAEEHCPTDTDSGVQCVPSHYLVSSLQMELDIAFLARATGDDTTERYFTMAANARRLAIQTILWNEDESQWFDYWLPVNDSKLQSVNSQRVVYDMDSGHLNLQIFASNFIPLWCGVLAPGDAKIERVLEAFNNSGLMHPGGIATSLRETGQQWDFPNAWAPLQHMIIEGLATLNSEKANKMAIDISRCWLKSNYVAFEETGHMVEKYDARYCGKVGGGGEYNTQTGFGWTNGVALTLLDKYGWAEDQPLAPTYNLIPWFTT